MSPLRIASPLISVLGLVSIVADGFAMPNGICFSPDDQTAYVADTGLVMKDRDPTRPATMYVSRSSVFEMTLMPSFPSYAFDVSDDGIFSNRRTFAFGESFSVESLVRPLILANVSSRSQLGESLNVDSQHIMHLADAVFSRSCPMAFIPIPRVTSVS